jgi:D-xylose transport system substrate-binding protein
MGPRTNRTAIAAAIGLVLTVPGCTGAAVKASGPGMKVGVIVSDPPSSTRWETDQPLLNDALSAEGLAPDVRNSAGDATQFAAIADDMISKGVKVLVLAAPNNEVGSAVAGKAAARHIPTIDYGEDRLNLGGAADYVVSFDPVKAGELQGRGVVLGIRGARVRGATIIEIDGAATDPTTGLRAQGARNILQPRYDTGAYRLVARRSVSTNPNGNNPNSNNTSAGAIFAQLLDAGGGHVDSVLAADDQVASAVIAVLRAKGLTGKVRVTGLGATPEALKAILRGDQFMTVFPAVDQQATAVAKLAGALARNHRAAAEKMVSMTVTDPIRHRQVRAVLVPPMFITVDTVKEVIDTRMVAAHDICDGDLALRCDQLDITR